MSRESPNPAALETIGSLLALRPGAWPVYGAIPSALLGGALTYGMLRLLSPLLRIWITNPVIRRRMALVGSLATALPLWSLGYMSGNPYWRLSPYIYNDEWQIEERE